MHMADALISPAVGGVMLAAGAGTIGYSVKKLKEDLDEKKVPLMGVMGAFVFAGQMINFTIPATGSSGHLGGGILLAALLGPYAAFLVITSVLLIQALFFADGGLLALGCNMINMGFFTCFIAYPLLYKPIVKRGFTKKRIALAAIIAAIVGLQLGSFGVVVQTLASGVTELPFASFAALMQPIHLAIGAVEGIATAAILLFIYKISPDLLDGNYPTGQTVSRLSFKKAVSILIVLAVLLGGGVSLMASGHPDGLEWSIAGVAGTSELEASGNIHKQAAILQELTALLPDYGFKNSGEGVTEAAGTSASGIIGGGITLAIVCLAGLIISRTKKKVKC